MTSLELGLKMMTWVRPRSVLVDIKLQRVRVAEIFVADLRQRVGHRDRVELDLVIMLGEVALRDLRALSQCRLYPLVEPGLNAVVEEDDGEGGDEYGRQGRDQAEQDDQAHV
jgi:hypothetical protein